MQVRRQESNVCNRAGLDESPIDYSNRTRWVQSCCPEGGSMVDTTDTDDIAYRNARYLDGIRCIFLI